MICLTTLEWSFPRQGNSPLIDGSGSRNQPKIIWHVKQNKKFKNFSKFHSIFGIPFTLKLAKRARKVSVLYYFTQLAYLESLVRLMPNLNVLVTLTI